jgi:hypothetical protein
MIPVPRWNELGTPACSGDDVEWFYAIQNGNDLENSKYEYEDALRVAKFICSNCEIIEHCRDWGIKHEKYGVWGGMSANERDRWRTKYGIVLQTPVTSVELVRLGFTRE